MKCSGCGTEIAAGSRFCNQCGASLVGVCPSCGTANSPEARFCSSCGSKLGDVSGETVASEVDLPYAERRHLTVLFSDLVGSTALSEQLDPEDLRAILRDYQAACSSVITLYDGYLAKYLGDGILAYFGYPTAHEDDAQRGVRAGLGIIEAMGKLSAHYQQRFGTRTDVRVGIHTGLVVVGDMGQSDSLEANAIVGQTPNMAARIQSLADLNALLISSDTRKLIHGFFESVDLGLHELKGISRPVHLYRVLHESTARSRLEAVASGLTPFTGREEEMDLLLQRWHRAHKGEGQIVLLGGEPGVGKSRVVLAMKEHATEDPDAWLTELRCSPFYQNSSLYPIIDFLERVVLRFTRDEPAEERLKKIDGWVTQYGFEPAATVPLLANLLSIPLGDRYAPLNLTPQKQKEKTIDLLISILLWRAEKQPVLFILEDLHWADPSTLELIDRFIARCAESSVLTLLTYRPQFKPYWDSRPSMIRIDLAGLPRNEGEEIVRRAAGGKDLPPEAVRYILDKTDGIPLFLEELTKMMLESEMLVDQDGVYRLSAPLESLPVPDTLQDSLTARLDRMREAKPVAQLGATIGREFSYEMIETIPGKHRNNLQENLARLVDAGLLYQKGAPPHAHYVFKHALIQDSAYSSLLKSSRRDYHKVIAEALEQHHPELIETQPELIGHHYSAADMPAQAIPYWQKAGQQAIFRSAMPEAIVHLSKAVELTAKLPEGPERMGVELMAQTFLGLAHMMNGGYAHPEVERAFTRARDLCSALGDPPQTFPVLHGLVKYRLVRGEYVTGVDLAEQLVRIAEAAGVPELLMEARYVKGAGHFWMGDLLPAMSDLEYVFDVYDPVAHALHASIYGEDPCVTAHGHHLWARAILGFPEQAIVEAEQAMAAALALGHPWTIDYLFVCITHTHSLLRDVEATLSWSQRMHDSATEHGFPSWMAASSVFHGWARACCGEVDEGIAETKGGVDLWRALGGVLGVPNFLLRLAEAYALGDNLTDAVKIVNEVLTMITTTGEGLYQAEAMRVKAEFLLRMSGDLSDANLVGQAERLLDEALVMADRQGARMWRVKVASSLVRLRRRQGRANEAVGILASAYAAFTEGFALPDLLDAKSLLDELSVT